MLKKKFACGCSVVKGTTTDEVHLQGDFADDLVDFFTDNYQVRQRKPDKTKLEVKEEQWNRKEEEEEEGRRLGKRKEEKREEEETWRQESRNFVTASKKGTVTEFGRVTKYSFFFVLFFVRSLTKQSNSWTQQRKRSRAHHNITPQHSFTHYVLFSVWCGGSVVPARTIYTLCL